MPSPATLELVKIFNPYFYRRYFSVFNAGRRFVHYTSASSAKSMIATRSVWMRNVRLMNDFSEVHFGTDLLVSAYHSGLGNRLRTAFSKISPGLCERVEQLFDTWRPELARRLYLTSISEHRGGCEDEFGRLSMWRAYGGQASIALVLNNAPFLCETDALNITTSPVLYADQNRFNKEFERFVVGVESNISNPLMNENEAYNRFYNALIAACTCTKHPGFFEEREWRILFNRGIDDQPEMESEIVEVRGVPQTVYKIPLKEIRMNGAGRDFVGADIAKLIDRLIIGPCDGAAVIRETFIELLEREGVPSPERKVVLSNIPLRNSV